MTPLYISAKPNRDVLSPFINTEELHNPLYRCSRSMQKHYTIHCTQRLVILFDATAVDCASRIQWP